MKLKFSGRVSFPFPVGDVTAQTLSSDPGFAQAFQQAVNDTLNNPRGNAIIDGIFYCPGDGRCSSSIAKFEVTQVNVDYRRVFTVPAGTDKDALMDKELDQMAPDGSDVSAFKTNVGTKLLANLRNSENVFKEQAETVIADAIVIESTGSTKAVAKEMSTGKIVFFCL